MLACLQHDSTALVPGCNGYLISVAPLGITDVTMVQSQLRRLMGSHLEATLCLWCPSSGSECAMSSSLGAQLPLVVAC